MTDTKDKPVQVQIIEANGRMDRFEKENKSDHKSIGSQLSELNKFTTVLKVLGIIGLGLMASLVALTASSLARLNQVEQKGSIEGASIDASLRRDVDRNTRDINFLEQVHRGRNDKE